MFSILQLVELIHFKPKFYHQVAFYFQILPPDGTWKVNWEIYRTSRWDRSKKPSKIGRKLSKLRIRNTVNIRRKIRNAFYKKENTCMQSTGNSRKCSQREMLLTIFLERTRHHAPVTNRVKWTHQKFHWCRNFLWGLGCYIRFRLEQ